MSLNTFSQTGTTNAKDSICFSIPRAQQIAIDLSKLDYLKGAIVLKDSTIEAYKRIDTLRTHRINEYALEVQEYTKQNKKLLKRSKRNIKIGGLIGLLIGLATHLIL